ncbi:MAG: Hsp20/alpha crystallin family protein [Anaerolineae bacterium]
MADIVRWEPFGELMSLREAMDRLLEESIVRPRSLLAPLFTEAIAVDMYETEDAVVVKAAVPGVKPEDLDISVSGDVLTIRGEVKQEEEVKRENYIRQERRYGSFCRQLPLPTSVNVDKATAEFEHGVLHLVLPKAEEVKPKSIKIKKKE